MSDLLSLVVSLTLTHAHSLWLTRSLASRQAFDAAGHTRACKETKKRHLQTHGARGFPPVCRRTCYTTRGCCCCLHRWTAINRRKWTWFQVRRKGSVTGGSRHPRTAFEAQTARHSRVVHSSIKTHTSCPSSSHILLFWQILRCRRTVVLWVSKTLLRFIYFVFGI